MRFTSKVVLSLATAGVLATSLTACGSSKSAAKPAANLTDLSGGVSTAVALDPGFTGALKSLMLTPGVTGNAKLTSAGSLVFPITGGNAKYYTPGTQPSGDAYVQGDIQHDGSGITLKGGNTTVALSNFDIDPGKSMLYTDISVNGGAAMKHVYTFFLDGSTLQPLSMSGGNAILQGTKVEISPAAADLLNSTFKTNAVMPDFLVGVATITLKTG